MIDNYVGTFAEFDNDSGDNFWGNIGAGILVYAKNTKKFLITYRSAFVNEPHTWGIIGGKLDDDVQSDIETAAKREFKEETQYKGNINELIPLYVFKTDTGSFEYHNFLGIIDNEFKVELDWENEDYKWLTLQELLEINPKHFGLDNLLNDKKSLDILKKLEKKTNNESYFKSLFLKNNFSEIELNSIINDNYFQDVEYYDDGLIVYRTISLVKHQVENFMKLNNNGIGEYWTLKNDLEPIWGNNAEYERDYPNEPIIDIRCKGFLNFKDIDWKMMRYAYDDDYHHFIDEKEIRGKNGSGVIFNIKCNILKNE